MPTTTVGKYLAAVEEAMSGEMPSPSMPPDFVKYLLQRVPTLRLNHFGPDSIIDRFGGVYPPQSKAAGPPTLGALLKAKDAEGHEHGPDGRFGNTGGGGSQPSDADAKAAPSKRPDLEEYLKKYPKLMSAPKPVQFTGTLYHATEDPDFAPSDSKGGGFFGPGLYLSDRAPSKNNAYGKHVHAFKADDVKLLDLDGDHGYEEARNEYHDGKSDPDAKFRDAMLAEGYDGIRVQRGIPGVMDVHIYVVWKPTASLTHGETTTHKALTVGELLKADA